MKNIQRAISPLLIVLCLCGFGVFECPPNKPRFCLTIFYILVSQLSYAYIAFKTRTFLQRHELNFPILQYTNMVFIILYTLSTFYYNKRFKSCLDKLNIVNNTLEKFRTSTNYAKLRIQIICLITGWILLLFLTNMNDYMWYREHIPRSYAIMVICAVFVANHPIHINSLYDFMNMMLLRYVGLQFEHVNKYIQELVEQKKNRVGCVWAISTSSLTHRHMADTEASKQNVWILMHIHLELCSIIRELNIIFGLPMVMQAIAFRVFTVQIIYECYVSITATYADFTYENLINLFCIYFWIIIYAIRIIIFNDICERVHIKANRTQMFLNRLTNLTFDVGTYEIITQFLLQIQRRPLKISGFGFFYFGFKFLFECVNFSAMIIIFVLQSPPRGSNYIGAQMRIL